MNLLTRAYISMKTRALKFKEDLKSDELGVSAIVATILILLIVVLMAAVFWDTISKWFSDTMKKIFDTADPNQFNEGDLGGN